MENFTAIQKIQEAIDENRDAMPTQVARQVLASTQKLYDGLDKTNEGEAMNPVETNEGEAVAMFRRIFYEAGLRGESLERRVRQRLAEA